MTALRSPLTRMALLGAFLALPLTASAQKPDDTTLALVKAMATEMAALKARVAQLDAKVAALQKAPAGMPPANGGAGNPVGLEGSLR